MGVVDKFLSAFTAASILGLLVSLYFYNPSEELNSRLLNVIDGLIKVEDKHISYSPKVAVGFGACVDLFVDGKDFMPYLDYADSPQHFDDVNSIEELYKSYAYYFRYGAAAERFMSNSSLFDQLVYSAEQLPNSRYVLGGNAPVMAMRLHKEGCRVLLGSTLTPLHRKAIPSDITIVGPEITRDDIHLILEYKAQEKWGPYSAPRANRYILHNDQNNPRVKSLEEFGSFLSKFSPDLFVVSGLQMLDNFPFPEGFREGRLEKIKSQMKQVSKKTKIHFEMASFSEAKLLDELHEYIIPYADSLGMNEQELANLYSLYRYGNLTLVTDSTPRVASVLDQMRELFRMIRGSRSSDQRLLTRLHVHTLAYQAILIERSTIWKDSDVAAAKASLTAYRHVCANPEVEVDSAALLLDDSFATSVESISARVQVVPEHPVSCWTEGPTEWCVAVGIVCTNVSQTAGGGDNISAAALAMQLHNM